MNKLLIITSLCVFALSARAQTIDQKVLYTTEIGGYAMLYILHADESGVYLLNSDNKLIKVGHNNKMLFEKSYAAILGNLSIEGICPFEGKILLLAKKYSEQEGFYTFYATYFDGTTGELYGELKPIAKIATRSIKGFRPFSRLQRTSTGDRLVIVVDKSPGYSPQSYSFIIVGRNLVDSKVVNVQIPHESGMYGFEDIELTRAGHIVLSGFRHVQKKKKKQFYFVVHSFDMEGRNISNIGACINQKYLLNGKMFLNERDELFLGGLFTKDSAGYNPDGVYLIKYDIKNGVAASSVFKEMHRKDLPFWKGKKKDEEDVVLEPFEFKDILYDQSDQSFYFTLEESSSALRGGQKTTTQEYWRKNIIVAKMKEGNSNAEWITAIPKEQLERIISWGGGLDHGLVASVARNSLYPYYSSYKSVLTDRKLIFFINDHVDNSDTQNPDSKIGTIVNFDKSILYSVAIDLKTGLYSRKEVFRNVSDKMILMPRFGFASDNEIYMVGRDAHLLKLSEFKLMKFTIKK